MSAMIRLKILLSPPRWCGTRLDVVGSVVGPAVSLMVELAVGLAVGFAVGVTVGNTWHGIDVGGASWMPGELEGWMAVLPGRPRRR